MTVKIYTALIRDCDGVIAYLDCSERIGTACEIGYAVASMRQIVLMTSPRRWHSCGTTSRSTRRTP